MSDLIKREDAIEAIGADIDEIDAFDPSAGIMKACIRRAIWKVMGVSSADRPQGEWKPKNHHTDYCSNCGFEETQWRTADYNYCPSCGARMKGADDEYTV